MSRLSQSFEQRFTGEKKLLPSRISSKYDTSSSYDIGVGKQILLQTKLAASGYVHDNIKTSGDNTAYVIDSLRRAIIEEVFGEFRHYFIELNVAMYEYDFDRMRTLLAKMEHQMFVE